MKMTRRRIEALLDRLADDYEVPFTEQIRAYWSARAAAVTGITIGQTWEADERLLMDECYQAIAKLLKSLPKNALL